MEKYFIPQNKVQNGVCKIQVLAGDSDVDYIVMLVTL